MSRHIFKLLNNHYLTPFLLSTLFFIIYSTHSIYRHLNFTSNAFDLGINVQATYLYSQHLIPYSTLKHFLHPADHFGVVLLFISPIYALFPDPITLLLIQAFFVSISGIFIYQIAFHKLQNKLFSLLITLSFLSFQGIQAAINFDFHLATISVLPLTLILYFWYFKKWKLYWIWIFLSLFFKDDIPLFIFGLGIYEFFTGDKKIGLTTSILALVGFYLIKFNLMPFLYNGAEQFYISSSVLPLSDPIALAYLLIKNPFIFTDQIFNSPIKINTLEYVYRGFAYLPILSPLSWLTVFPHLYLRFSSTQIYYWETFFHYNANIAPFLATSAILAVNKFQLKNRVWVILIVFFLTIGGLSPKTMLWSAPQLDFRSLERFSYLNQAITDIPNNASVSAQSPLVPHLANREKIYLFPEIYDAEYIVLDLSLSSYPLGKDQFLESVAALKKTKLWKVEKEDQTLLILKRTFD